MADKVLLTVAEAAERLGMGRTFVYGQVQTGDLPSVKLGRARRIPAAALEDYVKRLVADQCEGANWC